MPDTGQAQIVIDGYTYPITSLDAFFRLARDVAQEHAEEYAGDSVAASVYRRDFPAHARLINYFARGVKVDSGDDRPRLCWDRGPRIGNEGVAYCVREEGHGDGLPADHPDRAHRGHESFGYVQWSGLRDA